MNVEYTTISESLKEKTRNRELSKSDLQEIEELIMRDYEYYKKWKFWTTLFTSMFVVSFISVFVTLYLGSNNKLAIEAIFYALGALGFSFVTTCFSAIKINRSIHIKHALSYMEQYYPEVYNSYEL